MMKAIIVDVDGVLIGSKEGFNFPLPHIDVIKRLKEIRESGIPIILCSAKSPVALDPISLDANLDNPHISQGGAYIANPIRNTVVAEHEIDKKTMRDLIQKALGENIYTELHTAKDYYIAANQVGEYARQHAEVMMQEQIVVNNLLEIAEKEKILKILLFVQDKDHMWQADDILKEFTETISTVWTMHPTMLPSQAVVITAKGVSKRRGAEEVLESLGISFADTLGIGDTKGDWAFMELCGYAGVVGDESAELQELVKSKGEGIFFLGPSVDENGILKIFDYFLK